MLVMPAPHECTYRGVVTHDSTHASSCLQQVRQQDAGAASNLQGASTREEASDHDCSALFFPAIISKACNSLRVVVDAVNQLKVEPPVWPSQQLRGSAVNVV